MDTDNPLADALNTIAAIDPATIPKTYDIPPHLERIVQLAAAVTAKPENREEVDRAKKRIALARKALTPADLAILEGLTHD